MNIIDNLHQYRGPPRDLDSRTTITMDGKEVEVSADDLELLKELGRGAYGVVEKMRHRPSNTIMAVKVRSSKERMICCHNGDY